MRRYAVALLVNESEEYLRKLHGDDCFTDDIGCAMLFDAVKEIPILEMREYIVEVEDDVEDGIYVVGKYAG